MAWSMTFEKISIHPLNLDVAKTSFKKIAPSKEDYESVIEWLRDLTIEKALTERRQLRLLSDMNLFFKIYKKPIAKLTFNDLQTLKESLLNNNIHKKDKGNYSDSVKAGLSETLVRYLEHAHPKRLPEFVSKSNKPLRKWFIIKCKKKTPEVLTEQEVEKLFNTSKSIEGRFMIAVLFDAGCRIEEFANMRYEDFEEPTTNFPYYKIDFKEEYSKTEGRKIGLYWKHSTKSIAEFLATAKRQDMKERVFEKNYDAMRMFLTRHGMKILNKRVHPHMFRKSSATFYASKMNRQQMCVRYGWKFSSPMPDIYIQRKGIDEDRVKDVQLNDDISVLRKEILELKAKQEEYDKMFANVKKEALEIKQERIV